MSEQNDMQQGQREFLALLPLTLALAGLPESERGKYFSEEQIESRTFTVKHAYKAARALLRELIVR